MTELIKRFARNAAGRDFAVGDVHGHFTRLEGALASISFDPARDRLFSVGDLVDRGPESDRVVEFLDLPWFHAVRGNHEDMAIRWPLGNMDADNYVANGGAWNVANPHHTSQAIADALGTLPVAIEVDTTAGLIGIVHANCPLSTWTEFIAMLDDPGLSARARKSVIDAALWSRERIQSADRCGVPDVRAVIVGHTPVKCPQRLGNVYHIDTGGWMLGWHGLLNGHFSLLNLEALECLPAEVSILD